MLLMGADVWKPVFRRVPLRHWDFHNKRPFLWWTKEWNGRQILLVWRHGGCVWSWLGELLEGLVVLCSQQLSTCATLICEHTQSSNSHITMLRPCGIISEMPEWFLQLLSKLHGIPSKILSFPDCGSRDKMPMTNCHCSKPWYKRCSPKPQNP